MNGWIRERPSNVKPSRRSLERFVGGPLTEGKTVIGLDLMLYRDDRVAIEERADRLRRELERLPTSLFFKPAVEARRIGVETELAVCLGWLERSAPEVPILKRLPLDERCNDEWSSMDGSENVRRCSCCGREVVRLEAMTASEIESMILRAGGSPYRQLRRRADGTVIVETSPSRRPSLSKAEYVIMAVLVAAFVSMIFARSRTDISSKVDGSNAAVSGL